MSLIIKDKIPMFKVGYPTVSDKYNVAGGILAGTTPVKFGGLVKYGSTAGYYEAATGAITVDKLAGFVLATNVKLAEEWPGKTIQVNPGESFNLVLPGSYLAIELGATAVEGSIKPGKHVAITKTNSVITTSGVEGTEDLPNVTFTGLYEKHGSAIVAEIYIA